MPKPSRVVAWIVAVVATLITFTLDLLMGVVATFKPENLDWRLILPSLGSWTLMVWAWVTLFRRP